MSPEEIRNILLENKITGYQIGRDTPINQVTADNFLSGKSRPFASTLKIYETYIKGGFKPLVEKEVVSYVEEKSDKQNKVKGLNDDKLLHTISGVSITVQQLAELVVKNKEQLFNDKLFSLFIDNIKKDVIIEWLSNATTEEFKKAIKKTKK